MKLFPAIDLFAGKAVRLYQGDYAQMTVYSETPVQVARDFQEAGAACIHLVDLEGARTGEVSNLGLITEIIRQTGLFAQVGGGIRSLKTMETYLNAGVGRVILGTAAVGNPQLLGQALAEFGDQIAVGVDLKEGYVAIHGWTETAKLRGEDFLRSLEQMGVKTLICTDISRDGAMKGANREMYRTLSQKFSMDIIASGGVSGMEDILALKEMGLYGAIVGKAYYTGNLDLKQALEGAR